MASFQLRTRRPSDPHDEMVTLDDYSASYSSSSSFSSSPSSLSDFVHKSSRSRSRSRRRLSASLYPGQPRSLSGVASRAFILGIVASASLLLTLLLAVFPVQTTINSTTAGDINTSTTSTTTTTTTSTLWRVPFFLVALSTFHFLEFWTTARRNTLVATTDSFLLTSNGPSYAVAHVAALVECVVVSVWFPRRRWAASVLAVCLSFFYPQYAAQHQQQQQQQNLATALLVGLGLLLVLVGQTVRSAAMLHAGTSFNHQIQWSKSASHRLVTSGVYALLRHPSYFGFFYWALGTQLVLGNALCFVVYALALWAFFNRRIRLEEDRLVDFFRLDYVGYRDRVGTWMPFI